MISSLEFSLSSVKSFLNIKDLRERNATIKDFLATMDRIKKRNLNERSDFIDHQRHLEQKYEPVIASNKEMTEKITEHLIPIKQDLNHLNALIARPKAIPTPQQIIGVKRKRSDTSEGTEGVEDMILEEHTFGPLTVKFLNIDRDEENRKVKIDIVFGIRSEGNSWKIVNKRVTVNPDDSMEVGDETYKGTPRFWSLVVEKNPRNVTPDDLNRYKELLHETSAMHREYNPLSHHPRANRSKKWKKILGPIWREFEEIGVVEDSTSVGDGIKMYLRKDGKCYDLKKTIDGAMHISPRPKLADVYADGLYLRRLGSGMRCGDGFILGKNSPFKNIPILGWIL